jgi:hypothetical protein
LKIGHVHPSISGFFVAVEVVAFLMIDGALGSLCFNQILSGAFFPSIMIALVTPLSKDQFFLILLLITASYIEINVRLDK